MEIAIIGAGFCGLAVAWHLSHQAPTTPICHLSLFDAHGIGGGTSGIAAGLLHPYAGAHAKLNRLGTEGMSATLELLEAATQALGRPVVTQQGILRPAFNSEQMQDFAVCANKYPEDVDWLTIQQCQELFPYLAKAPGIWIKKGLTVNSPIYLQGLWQACAQRQIQFKKQLITSLKELKNFDQVIITTGAASFLELSKMSFSIVKGQVLELEWPSHLPILPFAINSQGYLLMTNKQTCLAGATYEREYKSNLPDITVAIKEILPKVINMIPALESAKIKACYAGLRAVTPNHLPLLEKVDDRTWLLTGMGSKGLLYHALMAEKLASRFWKEVL